MAVTEATLERMRRMADDNLSIGSSRRPRNSLVSQMQRASRDVLWLADEVDRLRAASTQAESLRELLAVEKTRPRA